MQEMLQQLNQMMSQQMQGGDTSEAMESFMQQWMPQAGQQQQMSLDQMMQQYQGQNQSMQSLLQSLSMPQREEMQDLLNKLSDDMGLREQLEELNKQLAQMRPKDPGNRHNFRGDDELDLQEALDLMKEMNSWTSWNEPSARLSTATAWKRWISKRSESCWENKKPTAWS